MCFLRLPSINKKFFIWNCAHNSRFYIIYCDCFGSKMEKSPTFCCFHVVVFFKSERVTKVRNNNKKITWKDNEVEFFMIYRYSFFWRQHRHLAVDVNCFSHNENLNEFFLSLHVSIWLSKNCKADWWHMGEFAR